jgi:hypothetical protein
MTGGTPDQLREEPFLPRSSKIQLREDQSMEEEPRFPLTSMPTIREEQ